MLRKPLRGGDAVYHTPSYRLHSHCLWGCSDLSMSVRRHLGVSPAWTLTISYSITYWEHPCVFTLRYPAAGQRTNIFVISFYVNYCFIYADSHVFPNLLCFAKHKSRCWQYTCYSFPTTSYVMSHYVTDKERDVLLPHRRINRLWPAQIWLKDLLWWCAKPRLTYAVCSHPSASDQFLHPNRALNKQTSYSSQTSSQQGLKFCTHILTPAEHCIVN